MFEKYFKIRFFPLADLTNEIGEDSNLHSLLIKEPTELIEKKSHDAKETTEGWRNMDTLKNCNKVEHEKKAVRKATRLCQFCNYSISVAAFSLHYEACKIYSNFTEKINNGSDYQYRQVTFSSKFNH